MDKPLTRQDCIELMRHHWHIARKMLFAFGTWRGYTVRLHYSRAHMYARLAKQAQ